MSQSPEKRRGSMGPEAGGLDLDLDEALEAPIQGSTTKALELIHTAAANNKRLGSIKTAAEELLDKYPPDNLALARWAPCCFNPPAEQAKLMRAGMDLLYNVAASLNTSVPHHNELIDAVCTGLMASVATSYAADEQALTSGLRAASFITGKGAKEPHIANVVKYLHGVCFSQHGWATPPKVVAQAKPLFQQMITSVMRRGGSGQTKFVKEAAYVVGALCRLSGDANEGKLMALRYVVDIVSLLNPVLSKSKVFLDTIRVDFFTALLTNCVSLHPGVLQGCLNILLNLYQKCLRGYKAEAGFILCNVVLRVLDSPNTNLELKHTVINHIMSIAQSPQILVDLFVNFDCDVRSHHLNVFQHLATCMCRIVRTSDASQKISVDVALALRTLVTMLQSMLLWSERPAVGGEAVTTEDAAKMREAKVLMQRRIDIINANPIKGVSKLVSDGVFADETAVAEFLISTPTVSPNSIGEYLSDPSPFCGAVATEFMKKLELAGKGMDEGLGFLLTTLQLPKEGQRIERLLEHFSSEYFEANRELSRSVATKDAAFVLAVALVMLNTDLHNPRVSSKMTRESFANQLRGCNADADFPPGFAEKLYESVKTNPFTAVRATGDSTPASPITQQSSLDMLFFSKEERREMLYGMERQRIVAETRDLLLRPVAVAPYVEAEDPFHAMQMFVTVWANALAVFSVKFEQLQQIAGKQPANGADPLLPETARLCVEGMESALLIAAKFRLDVEVETLVTSLLKMSNVEREQGNFGPYHIECVRSVVRIGAAQGNTITGSRTAWRSVAQCVSQSIRMDLKSVPVADLIASIPNLSDEALTAAITAFTERAIGDLPRRMLMDTILGFTKDLNAPQLIIVWDTVSKCFVDIALQSDDSGAFGCVDTLRAFVEHCMAEDAVREAVSVLQPFRVLVRGKTSTASVVETALRSAHTTIRLHESKLLEKEWRELFSMIAAASTNAASDISNLAGLLLKSVVQAMAEGDVVGESMIAVTTMASHTAMIGATSSVEPNTSTSSLEVLNTLFTRVLDSCDPANGVQMELVRQILVDFCLVLRDDRAAIRAKVIEVLQSAILMLPEGICFVSTAMCLTTTILTMAGVSQSGSGADDVVEKVFGHMEVAYPPPHFRRCSPEAWQVVSMAPTASLLVRPLLETSSAKSLNQLLPIVLHCLTSCAMTDNQSIARVGVETLMEVGECFAKMDSGHQYHSIILAAMSSVLSVSYADPALVIPHSSAPNVIKDKFKMREATKEDELPYSEMRKGMPRRHAHMEANVLVHALQCSAMRFSKLVPVVETIVYPDLSDRGNKKGAPTPAQCEYYHTLIANATRSYVMIHHPSLEALHEESKVSEGLVRNAFRAYFRSINKKLYGRLNAKGEAPAWQVAQRDALAKELVDESGKLLQTYADVCEKAHAPGGLVQELSEAVEEWLTEVLEFTHEGHGDWRWELRQRTVFSDAMYMNVITVVPSQSLTTRALVQRYLAAFLHRRTKQENGH